MRIDCETVPERGLRGHPSDVSTLRRSQASAQWKTTVPTASDQQQSDFAAGSGLPQLGRNRLPSEQEVLNFIALEYIQNVRPSKPEEFNGFLQYLKEVREVIILNVKPGSLILTVECGSLEILEGLWEDYCSGLLDSTAQKYLVTEEVLETFGLAEVKLTTTILEDEYMACRNYFLQFSGKFKMLLPVLTFMCFYFLKTSARH